MRTVGTWRWVRVRGRTRPEVCCRSFAIGTHFIRQEYKELMKVAGRAGASIDSPTRRSAFCQAPKARP